VLLIERLPADCPGRVDAFSVPYLRDKGHTTSNVLEAWPRDTTSPKARVTLVPEMTRQAPYARYMVGNTNLSLHVHGQTNNFSGSCVWVFEFNTVHCHLLYYTYVS